MRNRMTLASASIVVVIIAASSVSVHPGSAQILAQVLPQAKTTAPAKADECLARPGAPAPKGSHWYYRLERPSGRRCWYLGAVNQKVARERAAVRTPRVPTPAPAPAELRPDERTRGNAPAAATTETAPAAPVTNYSVAASQFSAAWPVAGGAANATSREATAPATREATAPATREATAPATREATAPATSEATAPATSEREATTVEAPSEARPPLRPAVSAADRPTAQPSEPAPGLIHLVIFLSATVAFVAIAFRTVLKLASMRRGRRNRRPAPRSAGPIIRTRAADLRAAEPSIEAMSEPAIGRLREIAKRWDAPTHGPRQPRVPAREVEPDYAVEGAALRRRQRVA